MPLYEYHCDNCGQIEVFQRFDDAPLTEHECGGKLIKVMTAPPAVIFKGTGWTEKQYK